MFTHKNQNLIITVYIEYAAYKTKLLLISYEQNAQQKKNDRTPLRGWHYSRHYIAACMHLRARGFQASNVCIVIIIS